MIERCECECQASIYRTGRTLTAASVVLRETTGQFAQVITPVLRTDLKLRTLRMVTLGPNEKTIIGRSNRVKRSDEIIAQRNEGANDERN